MIALVALIAAPFSYAFANLVQTAAVRRGSDGDRLDVGLLLRLAANPLYCAGFALQVLAFGLAFLARGTLPLYLVQAGTSASVGLTAIFGAVLLGWRIRAREVAALVVMGTGLVLLALAADPSTARPLSPLSIVLLVVLLCVAVLAAWAASRLGAVPGAIALGVAAGLAFGVLAIASRPLGALPLVDLLTQPTLWLVVLAAVLGQWILATAFQRGHTTETVAAMEAMSTVLGALGGMVLLADQVSAGRTALVPIGLLLVVSGVVWLTSSMSTPQLATTHTEGPANG